MIVRSFETFNNRNSRLMWWFLQRSLKVFFLEGKKAREGVNRPWLAWYAPQSIEPLFTVRRTKLFWKTEKNRKSNRDWRERGWWLFRLQKEITWEISQYSAINAALIIGERTDSAWLCDHPRLTASLPRQFLPLSFPTSQSYLQKAL